MFIKAWGLFLLVGISLPLRSFLHSDERLKSYHEMKRMFNQPVFVKILLKPQQNHKHIDFTKKDEIYKSAYVVDGKRVQR